jgi:subtilisin family serine protease
VYTRAKPLFIPSLTIMKKTVQTAFLVLSGTGLLHAQVSSVDKLEAKYLNWYNLDPGIDKVMGTGVTRTYNELLAGRPAKKTVVVAVIDSGVDIDHEDLRAHIWVNEDEIPGNGIDDDNNGYIDDIHGWNFIGNKNGENILYENMELTRLYKQDSEGKYHQQVSQAYEAELSKRKGEKADIERFEDNLNRARYLIKQKTGIDVRSAKDLDAISPDDGDEVVRASTFLAKRYEAGFTDEGLLQYKNHIREMLEKYLNVDFNPRGLVGDNPTDIADRNYGNPNVRGPRANHGTSVAGVIAAVRNNGLGTDGIATDVKIMCLRSTPSGDERDKDVALAIQYAVENGADIVNMSFGKPYSPEKKFVDDAVRLAEQRNVLLVHGSGNDGKDIDAEESYPSDRYLDRTEATNWINVGATGLRNDETLPAVFSNYGQRHVDVFAPGENIISTDSTNTYSMNDGTSLASPVVAGIAALLLSYHPELKPQDIIRILEESSVKMDKLKVMQPGRGQQERKKVKFNTLSKSGGVVNAYEAMKLADKIGNTK